ncbi:hypothetical protein SADUNF_Sadunf08G0002300 [Salix dunnii]|uniref:Uncharacterized protein n=1 Tax=Salix dunnii TaxID=1413687 RepID=A0A835JS12_9ROSI|nr:hypothetical protein SADUNF_Sadunf08G0002300 [Salix dunnii]
MSLLIPCRSGLKYLAVKGIKLNVFHGERFGLYPEVHSLDLDIEAGEIAGNVYLFLKEQL